MAKVEVRVCQDSAQWDALVWASPAGTVFHESVWTADAKLLLACHDGEALAGLPLASTPVTGALPHNTPYGGPILVSLAQTAQPLRIMRAVHEALATYVANEAPGCIFCTSPWGNTLEAWVTAGFRLTLLYTRVVNIADLTAAHGGFAGTLRRNLQAATRTGITVRREPARGALKALVVSTFIRQGRNPWFDVARAADRVDALARIGRGGAFVARDDNGNALAGAGVVWDHRRAYYVLGGRSGSHGHRGAMSLALWHAMRFVHDAVGLSEFDLEGSERPGISAFFDQFGGKARAYFHVSFGGGSIWDR